VPERLPPCDVASKREHFYQVSWVLLSLACVQGKFTAMIYFMVEASNITERGK
jgi:hypothetical protein